MEKQEISIRGRSSTLNKLTQSEVQESIITFIRNIPSGVTIIVSISIFNHNQHNLCGQFYYVATNFDPELGSSSGHDTKILMYIKTKYYKLGISAFV